MVRRSWEPWIYSQVGQKLWVTQGPIVCNQHLVRLSPLPVESVTIIMWTVLELSEIVGHSAGITKCFECGL